MKTLIVGKTIKEAKEFLNILSKSFTNNTIEIYTENKMTMKNGDIYYAISHLNNSEMRSCRCDRLYISKLIEDEISQKIIYHPMLLYSNLPFDERIIKFEL